MSMPLTPPISIIIPLFYCDESLYLPIERCLKSLQNIPYRELIIVDDASPLPLPNNWSITSYNEENEGFTKTVNKGLKEAKGDILVVMNDDIEMSQECFYRISHLNTNKCIIASPADTASSDDDRFGACFALTRKTYELLGGLNEKYRHFFSDTDYYRRAKEKKVEIIKWHDIVLPHPESSTYRLLDKEELLMDDLQK